MAVQRVPAESTGPTSNSSRATESGQEVAEARAEERVRQDASVTADAVEISDEARRRFAASDTSDRARGRALSNVIPKPPNRRGNLPLPTFEGPGPAGSRPSGVRNEAREVGSSVEEGNARRRIETRRSEGRPRPPERRDVEDRSAAENVERRRERPVAD